MKTLLAGLLLLGTLILSPLAAADPWYSSSFGFDRHRGWSAYPGYRHSGFSGYRHGGFPGYRRPFRSYYPAHRGNYFSFGFGNHYSRFGYRDYDFDSGALLGGIILGSLVSSSIRDYDRPREAVRYRTYPPRHSQKVIVVRPGTTSSTPAPGRRLLRDLQGNCFEISRRPNGDELRTQLDPSACNF